MHNWPPLFTLCSVFVGSVAALRIPPRQNAAHSTTIQFSSKSSSGDEGDFGFTSNGELYTGTIFLNGHPFQVALDTGSSDLWLDTSAIDVSSLINTNLTAGLSYFDQTAATGPILLGNITFGDFVVGSQAFISAPKSNATHGGEIQGVLGLGSKMNSAVWLTLANTSIGNPLLDNIFSIYPDEPSFITFLLSRSQIGATGGGIFTIGEVPEQFYEIQDTSPLEVVSSDIDPHWTINLDGVIIDGQIYTGHGSVPGSTIAMLDTGTSRALAPLFYVDAMYKSISGAQFDQPNTRYILPCDAKVDISIVFGNVTFPINPIDSVVMDHTLDNGTVICVGAFSYSNPLTEPDFVLGDTFLRNIFALFDFGNLTTAGDPARSIKLLSITNATQADAEFESANRARLAIVANSSSTDTGADNASDAGAASKPGVGGTKEVAASDLLESPDNSGSTSVDLGPLMRNSYIIIGLLGGVIVALLVGTVLLRKNKSYRVVPTSERLGAYEQPTPYDMPFNSHKD